MPDMREAFRKAANQNPDSKLAGVIKNIEYSQYTERRAERHARELEKLGGRFEYVGNMWLNRIMGNPIPILRTELRREWHQELLLQLHNNIEENDRPQLISRIADGLMLSERSNSSYKVISERTILSHPFRGLSDERFSPASKYFFQIVADISGYSENEKTDFRNFVVERVDIHGYSKLTDVFPAVAEWLVQQYNTAKKT